MSALDDTICAVATPAGEGGVGIVRISGSHALRVAAQNITLRQPRDWYALQPFRMYLGRFVTRDAAGAGSGSCRILDEVLVVFMRGPRSYTGEDVVEVHGHGGAAVMEVICRALIDSGARMAEPGEFTKRAFLHGRMDLAQAEAVLDTIRARSQLSLQLAQAQLQGKLSDVLKDMRQRLITMVAHLEAGLDFVEDDIHWIDDRQLRHGVGSLISEIEGLIQTSGEGRIIRDGIRAVIMGPPNVGKSSLLNRLLDTDRAIVSAIPGTTRDVLEESMMVDGVLVRFFDTAGLRASTDAIEQEGINRAREMIDAADLVLAVIDRSDDASYEILSTILRKLKQPYLIVLNKSDLPHRISTHTIETFLREGGIVENESVVAVPMVEVSAKTGEGLSELKARIRQQAIGDALETGEMVIVSRLRHTTLLKQARESLVEGAAMMDDGEVYPECLAMELRGALQSLGEIIGVVTNEDILDQVFRDFCIGK